MSRIRKLSPKQLRVMRWWQRDYDAVICDGAVRSGKTLCLGVSFLLWAMLCFQGQQFALCGKTIGALRRNLLPGVLEEVRGLGFRWEERRSENRITMHYRGRTNEILLFGGRDEGSAAMIQGVTLAGVLLDDAPVLRGAGLRPLLRAGEPVLVQLQPREPGALVLPGVDRPGGGAAGAVPPLHHGG